MRRRLVSPICSDPCAKVVVLHEHRPQVACSPESPTTEAAFLFCAFLAHPVAIFRLALVRAGLGLFLACSILWDLFAANRAIEWHHFRLPASLIEISPGRAWQTPAQNRRRRGDSTAQLYFPFPPFSGGCIRSSL